LGFGEPTPDDGAENAVLESTFCGTQSDNNRLISEKSVHRAATAGIIVRLSPNPPGGKPVVIQDQVTKGSIGSDRVLYYITKKLPNLIFLLIQNITRLRR